jgi:uncharacterized protein YjbI with pentapeptide repeats
VQAMADPNHLEILRRGVNFWNQWRKDNPRISPDLSEADLVGVDLRNANFGSDINDITNVTDSVDDLDDLKKLGRSERIGFVQISMGHIVATNFYHADLTSANLDCANLSHADLTWAHLTRTSLRNTALNAARLWFAEFHETEVAGADFTGTVIGWTKFNDTDLAVANGLKNARHVGPSSIGIDTLYRSQGKIPEEFMRGAGVPASFVAQAKDLVAISSFEFSSCFISYSNKDQKFAELLHRDLHRKGVRCWFAPKDLPIGSETRSRIDDAIRRHDKLLVVLSKHSVKSPWVQKEVETTFEKERLHDTVVLFPIRLDDAVMNTDNSWAADIRRMRNIGDFRKWNETSRYTEALDRLLQDLKETSSVSGGPVVPNRKLSEIKEIVSQGFMTGLSKKEIACIAQISMRTVARIFRQLENKRGLQIRNSTPRSKM